MSILNKYKHNEAQLIPVMDEYWDFVLSQDTTPSIPNGNFLTKRCLASYIDFGDKFCHEENGVHSYPEYHWENSVNKNVIMEDIGYTGIDNGLIYYSGWSRISNKDFFNIFTNSVISLEDDDYRMHLNIVTGNTGAYSYDLSKENGYYALNGGFFQGYYKLHGFDYQILPQYIENGWHIEITLRPKYYPIADNSLNNTHRENAGIFFYMGTRAEDKFVQFYNCDLSKYEERIQPKHELCENFIDGYFAPDGEETEDECNQCKKIKKENKEYNKKKAEMLAYFLYEYGFKNYESSFCGCGKEKKCDEKCNIDDYFADEDYKLNRYFSSYLSDCEDGYFEKDVIISGATLTTADGKPLEDSGYYEIQTDNKFLFFNRTKYGFTTSTWDENTVMILTGSTNDIHNENLFLLMNRTCSGYTVQTIDDYYKSSAKQYDLTKDILGNAFALKYNEDGSISYRYLVKDCDAEEKYSIISETSFPGLIKDDESWTTINVKFIILNGNTDNCGIPYGKRKMKIFFYVNGYLKFVSKELPEFDFRELNTMYEKQEAVPFNISVGGGTQGLCDSVWLDYDHAFEKILPIEKNFAGTFIGDIKSFKFYTCPMEYQEIKNNYLYEKNK